MKTMSSHGEFRAYEIEVCEVLGKYLENLERMPHKTYSKQVQEGVDAEIESYMAEYGATREEVVSAMLEEELESEVRK